MSEPPTVYDPRGLGAPAHAAPDALGNGRVTSSLDDLRNAVAQSEEVAEVEFADYYLYGPGRQIRLVCSTELSQPDFKRIQMAALPPEQRKRRMPDIKKLDEVAMFAHLIAKQTVGIEILGDDDETYRPMATETDRPLEDASVLGGLGVMDPVMAVRRIFGNRDAYIMRAGVELQEACGYGEARPGEMGEGADPT